MTRSSPPMNSELPEFLGGTVVDRVEVRPRLPNERPGHIPGEAGLWIFLLGDMTLFASIANLVREFNICDPPSEMLYDVVRAG